MENNSDCIYSSSESGATELRKKSSTSSISSQYKNIKYLPRPMTVGGIPSSLPSPEYINVGADNKPYHTKEVDSCGSLSTMVPKDVISKQDSTSSLDKHPNTIAPCEPKTSPEYLNMSFEKGKVQSEKQQHSNSAVDMKSTKGKRIILPVGAKNLNIETFICLIKI